VPSDYEPKREALSKKMFVERQTHSMRIECPRRMLPNGRWDPCWLR
jgi:hypothetical protein